MINIKENKEMISVQAESILDVIDQPCTSTSEYNQHQYNEFIGKNGDKNIISSRQTIMEIFGGHSGQADVLNSALLGNQKLYDDHFKDKVEQIMLPGSHVHDYKQNIKVIKRKRVRGYQGDELDIHKVYQGQLDRAWARMQRVEVAQQFHMVTILINYAGAHNQRAYDSMWRSAIAIRLTGELERAGKSVKIVVGSSARNPFHNNNGKILTTTFEIKKFNEPLNILRIAAMTHLGFYRTVGFSLACLQNKRVASNMGHSCSITENNMPLQLKEEVDAGHTKFISIGPVLDKASALQELKNCYSQMEEFSA